MTQMPSPRVLRVITRLNVGGPARQELALGPYLADRGFPNELIWGMAGRREGFLPVPPGHRHTCVPSLQRRIDPVADATAYRALSRLIRERRPSVVHTHMAKAGALARSAARRAGVPAIVHTFHGHVVEGYFSTLGSKAVLTAERALAKLTDALVAVSPSVRDELLDLGIGRREQWHVIPLGLDLRPILEAKVDVPAARRALGLPERGPVVATVGRLVPIKDHGTFLRAAASVAARDPDVTFAVIGDGELRAEVETDARRLLGDRVHFLGWVETLAALYAAVDVVVLTSRNEGTPVALIEAGAAGKPVVATRVGGVRDVIEDGVNGLLATAGDTAGVAAAIETILQAPALAAALGKEGRERAAGFSLERLADDLAALYAMLLERPAR